MARSREQAAELVTEGLVSVAGRVAEKPATQVELAAPILVTAPDNAPTYVSRGGHKLAGALAAFTPAGFVVAGRRCLDAGASTGGFTDVLLRAGASHVVAVDVGYGQLAWVLRGDPRVTVLDRTNVRSVEPAAIGEPVDVVVADLSFISLRLVLPALRRCLADLAADADLGEGADLALMVKPQFEVGRERLGAGGVVREPAHREAAVLDVAAAAYAVGLGTRGVVASPLPGPAGNVEYFLWLRPGAPPPEPETVRRAVAEGPA
jgi:23S rRNA (cytidine1920-2'-O)/16S rRNA (cytidine1409-2'-O)-methyltransferase